MADSSGDDPKRRPAQGYLREASEENPHLLGPSRPGTFLVPVEPSGPSQEPEPHARTSVAPEARTRLEALRADVLALARDERKPLLVALFADRAAADLMRSPPDERAIRTRYEKLAAQVTEADRAHGEVVAMAQVRAARRSLDRVAGSGDDLARRVWEEFAALQERSLRERLGFLSTHENHEVIPHTHLAQVRRALEDHGYDPEKAHEHVERVGFRLERTPTPTAPPISAPPPPPAPTGRLLSWLATAVLVVVALLRGPWSDAPEPDALDGDTTEHPVLPSAPDVVVAPRAVRRCELSPRPVFPDGDVARAQGVEVTRLDERQVGVGWVDPEWRARGLTLDVRGEVTPVAAPPRGLGVRVRRALLTAGASRSANWLLDTEEAIAGHPRLLTCGDRLVLSQRPPEPGMSSVFWCRSIGAGAVLALRTQWDEAQRPASPARFNVYFPDVGEPVSAWTYELPNPASVLRASDPMRALFDGYRPSEVRVARSPGVGMLVVVTRHDGRHHNIFYGWINADKRPLAERMVPLGTNLERATKPDPALAADDRGAVMVYADRDPVSGRIGLRRVRFESGQVTAPVPILGVPDTTESEHNPSLAHFSWGWLLTWTLGNDRVMLREYGPTFEPLGPPMPVRPSPLSDPQLIAFDDQHFALVAMFGNGAAVRRLMVRTGDCTSRPVSAPPPDGATRVAIPAGSYLPRSLPAGRAPAAVEVPAFEIDRHEVSVREYEACVAVGACPPVYPQDIPEGLALCGTGNEHRLDRPINCVNWEQADLYCAWKTGRLPTEIEWEYAASGGRDYDFPWGYEPPAPERANGCWGECRSLFGGGEAGAIGRDPWETTAPVESFPEGASPFGVQHLADNVSEWTAGAADARGGRIVRGGSWRATSADAMALHARVVRGATTADPTIGFRCAYTRR